MSKFLYGVEFLREYDPRDQEHISRKGRLCELPSGPKLLPDAFDCILARVSYPPLLVLYLANFMDTERQGQGVYRLQP